MRVSRRPPTPLRAFCAYLGQFVFSWLIGD
jgi:hypothetical protein